MRAAVVLALAIAMLLQLAACGSSDEGSSTGGIESITTNPALSAPKPENEKPVQAADGGWPVLKRFAGSHADELIVPQGPSPDHVVIRDLAKGSGPAIEPGDIFVSHYISFDYENEKVVEPLPETQNGKITWLDAGSLKWGVGERVQGWEPGLEGIKAGGLRELIVPSRLAYGNNVRVYLIKVHEIEP
jgi:peptidylprolyl isomerase